MKHVIQDIFERSNRNPVADDIISENLRAAGHLVDMASDRAGGVGLLNEADDLRVLASQLKCLADCFDLDKIGEAQNAK